MYLAAPIGECSSRSSMTHTPMRRSPAVRSRSVSSCRHRSNFCGVAINSSAVVKRVARKIGSAPTGRP